jgi:HAD superfamily hydrolase (TIGR01509 family)
MAASKTIDGLENFMEEIKAAGLPIALASSASRGRVESALNRLNLRPKFQVVMAGDDVAQGKPDPTIFLLAAQRLGVKAQNVLVCEDAINGIEAAKAAGMKCLAIATNGRGPLLKSAGADLIVPDFKAVNLEELRKFFLY